MTPGDDPGLPSSWGTLMCLRPALRPRRDQHYRDKAIAASRHGPTHSVPRGLSTRGNFGAPSHGISTRCLRFAVRISPPHARLASGCGPSSTRRDWLPAGFLRKVSEMFLTSLPPFPSFLAQTLTPYPPGVARPFALVAACGPHPASCQVPKVRHPTLLPTPILRGASLVLPPTTFLNRTPQDISAPSSKDPHEKQE
jgi:hypothetical protein